MCKNKADSKTKAKYLGVWLDQRLNFRTHVKYTVKRAGKTVDGLATLASSTWGMETAYLRQLYKACVQPVLTSTSAWMQRLY
jgi:hypothetical protein